jgi:small subunit ribosomal protein S20
LANHPSALKRHRQSRKRRERNISAKSRVRTLIRSVNTAVEAGDKATADARLKEASVALAKGASKGLHHRANASRRTGRLARKVAALS